ncbi:type VI secretion system-associated FHA domain protein TagH [Alkalimarinus coralli]|uniref:type VI secretion system-associated FHA domain protein TagH n=1 Tax=Alkalimarinus coralli TaxID=2935863 RepID=UPI00202B23B0|nr:type VI secretion system-associated FHA domain protein TagH [Alkalimarinus coralli]
MELLFRVESVQSEETPHSDTHSLGSSNQAPSQGYYFSFSPLGGLIGRSAECDWVLADPDRRLSGKHAAISFENQQFFITDLSTNGLFVNSSRSPLGKGNSHLIQPGDQLTMGPYTISANVREATENIAETGLSGEDLANADMSAETLPENGVENAGVNALHGDEQTARTLDSILSHDDRSISTRRDLEPDEISLVEHEHLIHANQLGLDDIIELPTPLKDKTENPIKSSGCRNSSREHSQPSSSLNTTREAPNTAPPISRDSGTSTTEDKEADHLAVMAFLRGAGLDEGLLSRSDINQLMFNFGGLLKCYTGELMKLMGERSSYKNQCRLDMTLIAPEHNNPLKYCVNEAQALREIVISPQPENLSGGRAVESAMADIRDHYWRVEKAYQGTLSSLVEYLGVSSNNGETPPAIIHKSKSASGLSARPWQYRKQIKALKHKTTLLKDPDYYSDEFFSPRFSYYYQNPDRATSEAEKQDG